MLYLSCGVPGSGKSTFAKSFQRSQTNITILCPDDFRKEMLGTWWHAPAEDFIWAQVKMTARVLLKSEHNLLIDGTSLTPQRRREWIRIANDCGHLTTAIAFITLKIY